MHVHDTTFYLKVKKTGMNELKRYFMNCASIDNKNVLKLMAHTWHGQPMYENKF